MPDIEWGTVPGRRDGMVILLSAATLWVLIAVLLALIIGRSIRLADRRARNAAQPRLSMQESQPADDTAAPRPEAEPGIRTQPPAGRGPRHSPHGGTAGRRTRRPSRT